MIADLHNDCLLEIKNKSKLKNYLQNNKKYLSSLCLPIWTTELNNPVQVLEEKYNLLKSFSINYDINFCIEDLGFVSENNFCWLKDLKPFYSLKLNIKY